MFNEISYELRIASADVEDARKAVELLHSVALDEPFESVSEIVEIVPGEVENHVRKVPNENVDPTSSGPGSFGIRSALVFSLQKPTDWAIQDAARQVDDCSCIFVPPTRVIAFKAEPGGNSQRVSIGLAEYPSHFDGVSTGLTGWSWKSYCDTSRLDKGKPSLNDEHRMVAKYLQKVRDCGFLTGFRDRSKFYSMSASTE